MKKLLVYLIKNLLLTRKTVVGQKLLEYKVKKGDLEELLVRMDIIPTSIALAQAIKKVVGNFRLL